MHMDFTELGAIICLGNKQNSVNNSSYL